MSKNISKQIDKIRNKIMELEQELEYLEEQEDELKKQELEDVKDSWKFANIIYLMNDVITKKKELMSACDEFYENRIETDCVSCSDYNLSFCPYSVACSMINYERDEMDWAGVIKDYIEEYEGERNGNN